MKRFIGTKLINAEPMMLLAAEQKLGRDVGYDGDLDANGDAEGYLVEYQEQTKGSKGKYQTWSPKDVFEAAYRPIDNMTFGLAIEALKQGKKVARAGWNGKGIFIYIPTEIGEMTNPFIAINTTGLYTDNAAAPKCIVPWLASQTDMLAADWTIVE